MSSFSLQRRFSILVLVLSASFASAAIAADPNVVRASHSQTANDESRESDNAKPDDMSYSPQWPEPPNTGAMLVRLCVGTFVVLGVCVGTLWFGKPWLQRLKVAGAGSPSLFIEGSVGVGNRAMLYLVRVGSTQLVVGTDSTGLKSMIVIPATFKEVLDEQVPEIETDAVAMPNPFPPIEMVGQTAPQVITSPRSFDRRTFNRSDSQE